jgi:hypothetical protein
MSTENKAQLKLIEQTARKTWEQVRAENLAIINGVAQAAQEAGKPMDIKQKATEGRLLLRAEKRELMVDEAIVIAQAKGRANGPCWIDAFIGMTEDMGDRCYATKEAKARWEKGIRIVS